MIRMANLADWQHVPLDEWMVMETHAAKPKKFRLNSTEKVEVWAALDDQTEVFIGSADGFEEFEVTAAKLCIVVRSAHDAQVFMETRAKPQFVARPGGESFTDLHPRKRRNSDLDRMMHLLKVNDAQRQREYALNEQRHQERYAALEAQLQDKADDVIEEDQAQQGQKTGDTAPDKKTDQPGDDKKEAPADE